MEAQKPETAKKSYEAPKLVELGTLHELTQQLVPGHECGHGCFHNGSLAVVHH